jgi:hypothetical protein
MVQTGVCFQSLTDCHIQVTSLSGVRLTQDRLIPRCLMFVETMLRSSVPVPQGTLRLHYKYRLKAFREVVALYWKDNSKHFPHYLLRAGRQSGRSSRPGRGRNFLFSTSSRPTLGPTHPPIQWVPGAFSQGVKRPTREADHSTPTSAKVQKFGSIHPLPHTFSWRSA